MYELYRYTNMTEIKANITLINKGLYYNYKYDCVCSIFILKYIITLRILV